MSRLLQVHQWGPVTLALLWFLIVGLLIVPINGWSADESEITAVGSGSTRLSLATRVRVLEDRLREHQAVIRSIQPAATRNTSIFYWHESGQRESGVSRDHDGEARPIQTLQEMGTAVFYRHQYRIEEEDLTFNREWKLADEHGRPDVLHCRHCRSCLLDQSQLRTPVFNIFAS